MERDNKGIKIVADVLDFTTKKGDEFADRVISGLDRKLGKSGRGKVVIAAGMILSGAVIGLAGIMASSAATAGAHSLVGILNLASSVSGAVFMGTSAAFVLGAGVKSIVEAKKEKRGKSFLTGVFALTVLGVTGFGGLSTLCGVDAIKTIKKANRVGFAEVGKEFSKVSEPRRLEEVKAVKVVNNNKFVVKL